MSSAPCPSCGCPDDARPAVVAVSPFPASPACYAAYLDLAAYNVARARTDFLHQEAVDAYAAQHPGPPAKAITLWFALVGLHLAVDLGRTGRQVQRAHQRLAAQGRSWDLLPPPADLTGTTVASVLAREPGEQRDVAILEWAAEVWGRWEHVHADVATLQHDAGL